MEIDDFFQADHENRGDGSTDKKTKIVSNKTLDNWKNLFFRFWTWAVRREKHRFRLVMQEFRNQDLFASRKVAEMQNQVDPPVTNLFGFSKKVK